MAVQSISALCLSYRSVVKECFCRSGIHVMFEALGQLTVKRSLCMHHADGSLCYIHNREWVRMRMLSPKEISKTSKEISSRTFPGMQQRSVIHEAHRLGRATADINHNTTSAT